MSVCESPRREAYSSADMAVGLSRRGDDLRGESGIWEILGLGIQRWGRGRSGKHTFREEKNSEL